MCPSPRERRRHGGRSRGKPPSNRTAYRTGEASVWTAQAEEWIDGLVAWRVRPGGPTVWREWAILLSVFGHRLKRIRVRAQVRDWAAGRIGGRTDERPWVRLSARSAQPQRVDDLRGASSGATRDRMPLQVTFRWVTNGMPWRRARSDRAGHAYGRQCHGASVYGRARDRP